MSLSNLDNLAKTGQLKSEPFDQNEFIGLINSGKARLNDALNTTLAQESRFDLAYNAAHSFALAALRKQNYRANNRYIVFQALPYTSKMDFFTAIAVINSILAEKMPENYQKHYYLPL